MARDFSGLVLPAPLRKMKRKETTAEATDPCISSSVRIPRKICVHEAKTFWQSQRKEGTIDVIFKKVQSKLQFLCQKIKDGAATNQDYVSALTLVNNVSFLEDTETFPSDQSSSEELTEDEDCLPARAEKPLPSPIKSELSRCACLQLTAKELGADVTLPKRGLAAGYKYKRLQTPVPTGLYECNVSCECDRKMCQNRVVQHGLQVRLQVFNTKGKGWGVRCLDDLDKGTFVCIYAGRILMKTVSINTGQETTKQTPAKKTTTICVGNKRGVSFSDSELAAHPSVSSITQKFRLTPLSGFLQAETKRKRFCQVEGKLNYTSMKRPKTKTSILQKRRRQLIEQGTVTVQHSSDEEPFTPPPSPKRLPPGPCEDDTVKGVFAPMGNSVLNNEAGYVSDESSSSVQGGAEEKSDPPDTKTGENIYFLDASTEGNVGRFLNHSCSPNLFVQHVFVETHSKNFPWVAFFTKRYIFSLLLEGYSDLSSEHWSWPLCSCPLAHQRLSVSGSMDVPQPQDARTSIEGLDMFRGGEVAMCQHLDPESGLFCKQHRRTSLKLPAAFLVIRTLQAWEQTSGPASLLFIKAGTELTWEYNYDIGNVPETEISCLCGHKKCKNKII
ncbi:histone-lysine N-methyltransferase SETDB2 isoform X4 [Dendrobates tinctorius]|uniref:histone-lysine N-methyltransferase SETDB2 isoform X4 n=1 Tax=Dendrobates tinctorius TaxID=92724 RepID=UPI003CC9548A